MSNFDIGQILEHIPHRYPFLLIDRVIEYKKDTSLTALKNVTINEPFFQGHFPHLPLMPGVLVIEAMAQSSGILAFRSLGLAPGTSGAIYLVGIDKARFRRPVVPGDQLKLTVSVTRRMKGIWKFDGVAHVDGKVCVTAELMSTYRAEPE